MFKVPLPCHSYKKSCKSSVSDPFCKAIALPQHNMRKICINISNGDLTESIFKVLEYYMHQGISQ